MKHVPLNEYLSDKSNWPKRLLGWEPYSVDRSPARVTQEYDRDRYAPLLSLNSTEIEDYKIAEFNELNMDQQDPMFISFGEEVFCTDVRTARLIWYSLISSAAGRFATGTICELGCGYGYNLHLLGGGAYGGEYSQSAVELGRRLGLAIERLDYHCPQDYSLIRRGSTVLTVHSIEQMPSAQPFIDNLSRVRSQVREVIHFEPTFLPERRSFMGMIRNRYNQLIDHNHDLVKLLRDRSDVEILHFEADVFGLHPLNSSNLLVWRFR
ncbi:MAG: hypothetical protein WB992_20190 [Bryobacteraceae bacterium]